MEVLQQLENISNTDDICDILDTMLEDNVNITFSIIFKLLQKFNKNVIFHVQCMAILKYIITCESFDVPIINENENVKIINMSLNLVNKNRSELNDEEITQYIEDCIIVLYKLNTDIHELKILERMYNDYSTNLSHVKCFIQN